MTDPAPPLPALEAILGFRLVTADLPRLTRFYTERLGFVPLGPPSALGPDAMARLGLTGGGLRQSLRIGAQTVAIDWFENGGAPYPAGADAASTVFQHLALVVGDMAAAYGRLGPVTTISEGGPQALPASSGGVVAFKFRDPDSHPLEFLQFPAGRVPAAWQGKTPDDGGIVLGIDHSAISVSDAQASQAFYNACGLKTGDPTLNQGEAQEALDGLPGVRVRVVPLQPAQSPPHLELLGYEHPREAGPRPSRVNDVATTRLVWAGPAPALFRDPDGHLHEVELRGDQPR